MTSGWETMGRLVRADMLPGLTQMFEVDRLARASGQKAMTVPVCHDNPLVPSSLPSADAYKFFIEWESKLQGKWINEVTVRSLEACRAHNPSLHISRISPTPLLMLIADNDCVTPTDLALSAYNRANEPKEYVLLPCGHFDAYVDPIFSYSIGKQVEFLKKTLCK